MGEIVVPFGLLDRLLPSFDSDAFARKIAPMLDVGDPQVRSYAERLNALGNALLRRETDEAGRTRNIGQILGLVPVGPGGLSAGQAVALRRRNALIRHRGIAEIGSFEELEGG